MTAPFHPLDAWRTTPYDAVIVGGGPAGLSAALVLGPRAQARARGRRRPAGERRLPGRRRAARARPGRSRRTCATSGRRQLGEHATSSSATAPSRTSSRTATCSWSGSTEGPPVRAHAIVLAHGLRYDPPSLPGIDALWGRSVFHCAFCDGWEVRDRPLGVPRQRPRRRALGARARGLEQRRRAVHRRRARPRRRASLAAAGVRVRTEPIARLAGHDGRLEQIEFAHGPAELPRRAVREHAPGPAERARRRARLRADRRRDDRHRRRRADQRPGVYAAGDAATAHSRSVANAIGTGSRVAYAVALARLAPAVAAAA